MADQTMKVAPGNGGVLGNVAEKLVDMGDGTHARVLISAQAGATGVTRAIAPRGGALKNVNEKLVDMGDGTHARAVALVAAL